MNLWIHIQTFSKSGVFNWDKLSSDSIQRQQEKANANEQNPTAIVKWRSEDGMEIK